MSGFRRTACRFYGWLRNEPVTAITGAVGAAAVVGADLGLSISPGKLAAVDAFIVAAMALIVRPQVTPTAALRAKAKASVRRTVVGNHPTRKTGRRVPDPRKVARGILDLTPSLRTGTAVPTPSAEDYLARVDWAGTMLGNNEAGDCEAVRVANWLRLLTSFLGTAVQQLTQAQVWAIYATQNPKFTPDDNKRTGFGSPADGGMDTQTLLEFLSTHGFDADGALVPASATVPALVVAFGKVDPTDSAAVETAIAVFGGVWVDIIVLDANQQQFETGQPWTDVAGSPVDGGHAVLSGGYWPPKIVTWAAETELAPSFWSGSVQGQPLVESVWVAIHPDHLGTKAFLASVDVATLAADFHALTGKTLPIPVPVPVPSPTPTPEGAVEVTDPALVAHLEALAAKAGETPDAFLAARLHKLYPTA